MFTGIVQEVGQVIALNRQGPELRFELDLKSLSQEKLKIGESVCVNGACHTLEAINGNRGVFFSSEETLKKTNLTFLRIGDFVNLELPLTPNSRLGGHFVSGHVDAMAKILSISAVKDAWILTCELPSQFGKYVVEKGSVALNGIGLTVTDFKADCNIFSVAIIPHTYTHTNLQFLQAGHLLNLEVDLLAKYVESMLRTYLTQKNFA